MTVLLDTSVLIGGDQSEWASVDDDASVVSAITIAELAYGLEIGDPVQRDLREERLRRIVRNFEVIPFGVEEAKLYGVLAQLVRAAGRNPRPRRLDLQIAATAAAARLPLVTANPRDFAGFGGLVDVIGV